MTRQAGAVFGMLVLAQVAAAQITQQGSKLVGTGAAGPAAQGYSVALSADGNTAIVGGWTDDDLTGAAWVYTRTGNVWSQQGEKLVGSGAVGPASQGFSVAISADGDTAIMGGWTDNSLAGAAWVFTRTGGKWSQQGSKLVGSGGVWTANQGFSVAIAADGGTAIVGGPSAVSDSADPGAAWVFTRSGGVWSQQGGKLVAMGAVGTALFGVSVAISGDGNAAIVGGPGDNATAGAAWVFTRSGGQWLQQGGKLVGGGAVGAANQGFSVAISVDAHTAVVGGPKDSYAPPDSWPGAAWVFTRSGGAWSQQGGKMVGADAVGAAGQGCSVAISGDGNSAIVGGPYDGAQAGAAWVYKRSGGVWSQQGSKLIGSGAVGAAGQGWSVGISADGTEAIAGGFHDDSDAGAAWVFAVNGCAPPSITGQPQSQSVRSGQTATLSVTANGAAPLFYQWFLGVSGETSQPVGTDASSFTTPALTTAASYLEGRAWRAARRLGGVECSGVSPARGTHGRGDAARGLVLTRKVTLLFGRQERRPTAPRSGSAGRGLSGGGTRSVVRDVRLRPDDRAVERVLAVGVHDDLPRRAAPHRGARPGVEPPGVRQVPADHHRSADRAVDLDQARLRRRARPRPSRAAGPAPAVRSRASRAATLSGRRFPWGQRRS